jgi:hypothetical protein
MGTGKFVRLRHPATIETHILLGVIYYALFALHIYLSKLVRACPFPPPLLQANNSMELEMLEGQGERLRKDNLALQRRLQAALAALATYGSPLAGPGNLAARMAQVSWQVIRVAAPVLLGVCWLECPDALVLHCTTYKSAFALL